MDGAYGALAAAAPSGASLRAGLASADSLSLDPHKWLFVPIDTSCLLVRDVASMRRFFTVIPEYLKVSAAEQEVPQPMESTIELSRRFRALRLWMVLKAYGAEAIRGRIEEHLTLARKLASWIESAAEFELAAPVETSTVAFRYVPAKGLDPEELDRLNEAMFDRLNREPGSSCRATGFGGASRCGPASPAFARRKRTSAACGRPAGKRRTRSGRIDLWRRHQPVPESDLQA